jgi:integrase
MATFRKRNGIWQVQIRRAGCKPLSKSFTFKSDADSWARQMEGEIDRQAIPVDRQALNQLSLTELLNRYLTEISPRKKGHIIERCIIENIKRSDLGKLKLVQVVPQTVAQYRDTRLKNVQPNTVIRELTVLCHVFETARKEWLIPIAINPVTAIRKPVPPEARKRRMTENERMKLLEACSGLKNQNMAKLISFAIETGMRRNEITCLTWNNVNFHDNTLYLPMTKNGLSRTVPLTPKAYDILVSLFPKEQGSVFNLTNVAVRQSWDRLIARAGIEDLHFHDLRHEAISRFFELGLSVPEVALISGHKDMRMLFRYTHLKAENVADKLASLG